MLRRSSKILVAVLGMTMLAGSAFGMSVQDKIRRDIEAAAALTIINGIANGPAEFPLGNPGDWIKLRYAEVKEISDALVDMYDENGNGKVDVGPEWDELKVALDELAVVFLDEMGNGDGELTKDDLDGIVDYVLGSFDDAVKVELCKLDLLAKIGIKTPWYKQNCM